MLKNCKNKGLFSLHQPSNKQLDVSESSSPVMLSLSTRRWFMVSFLLQMGILFYLSSTPLNGMLWTSGVGLFLLFFIYQRLQQAVAMPVAHQVVMLAWSNLGMLVGWLIDLQFQPFTAHLVSSCCLKVDPGFWSSGCLCPWMYGGMYLGCLPMFFTRIFNNCSKSQMAWGCLGMGPGMYVGTCLIYFFSSDFTDALFWITFIFMLVGMFIGMFLFERLFVFIHHKVYLK